MRSIWVLAAAAACSTPSAPLPPPPPPPASPPPLLASDAAAPVTRRYREHAIAAADSYACATSDERVKCWGATPGPRWLVPTLVPGLQGIAGIAAGDRLLYAWSADGHAWQWSGTKTSRLPLAEVVAITADEDYACARHRDARVSCWRTIAPAATTAIDIRASEVVVAGYHACARTAADVLCWAVDEPTPIAFTDARGAIDLAGRSRGSFDAAVFGAVMPTGAVVQWEQPSGKRLPAPMLPADVVKLSIGRYETCALGTRLVCWHAAPASMREVTLPGVHAIDIAVADWIACAEASDARVACWGRADAIGDGRGARIDTPVDIAITDAVELGASDRGTCARRANGAVACWGERLADDWTKIIRVVDLQPARVDTIDDAVDLAVAIRNACVRRASGRVACWGTSDEPHGAMQTRPTEVPRYTATSTLVVDGASVCGLAAGAVVCRLDTGRMFAPFPKGASRLWSGGRFRTTFLCAKVGKGVSCQEGFHGRHDDSGAGPTTLETDLSDVVDMHLPDSQGTEALCLLRKAGEIECRSVHGTTWMPIEIEDGIALAPGANHDVCALRANGTVACFTSEEPATIKPVRKLADVVELVGGGRHACARRKSGQVACWGDASLTGAGGRADSDTPAFIVL